MSDASRPSIYIGKIGTSFYLGTVQARRHRPGRGRPRHGCLVEPEQLTAYPVICPLTVTKLIDPSGPRQSGDIVTITIRYANTGAKAISDLVVSDSLSGRLEYVAGSARDRPAGQLHVGRERGRFGRGSLGPARRAACRGRRARCGSRRRFDDAEGNVATTRWRSTGIQAN